LSESICVSDSICRENCGDIESECSKLLEILSSRKRSSLSKCHVCLLREFFESQEDIVMMPYTQDDEEILFIRYRDLFFELREETGEVIPLNELSEYLSDVEEFLIYPREVVNELRKWFLEE